MPSHALLQLKSYQWPKQPQCHCSILQFTTGSGTGQGQPYGTKWGGIVVLGSATTTAHPCCQVSFCILREHLSCSCPGPRPHSLPLRTEWPSCWQQCFLHAFAAPAAGLVLKGCHRAATLPHTETPHTLPLTLLCRAETLSRALPKVCEQSSGSSVRSCWCDPCGDKSLQAKHPHPKRLTALCFWEGLVQVSQTLGISLTNATSFSPPFLCVH